MHPMLSGIKDNYLRGKAADFLEEHLKDGSNVAIVSAYFTIQAYHALKAKFDRIDHADFLFGDISSVRSIDPKTNKKTFTIEEEGLSLRERIAQRRVALEAERWIQSKVSIKSIKKGRLIHGKLYHIDHHGIEHALSGSSNFTLSGLGLNANANIELNLVVDSDRDKKDLKNWFYELWNNEELVEDVKDEVIREIRRLHENNAPEFIYYKTLYHIFERFLLEQEQSGLLIEQTDLFDAEIWQTLFEFQRDAVKGAINKILTHNGCIIADSVGLGKTYEALAIIKYFELRNHRVLVLCPKKLRENWTVYQAQNNSRLNPFPNDKFAYTVLSHTDLSRDGGKSGDIDLAALHWNNYDLVVIDESHNFRNNTRGKRDDEGNVIRKSRYERLLEDILQSGQKTKVLLLSATPVNTDLRDLRNQIYFLTAGRDDAFQDSIGIASVKDTLALAQRNFTEWAKKKEKLLGSKDLLERLDSAFFKLLDELTIARSRKHIYLYYEHVLEQFGGFPQRQKPISIFPNIDSADLFMSYDMLNDQISNYKLSLFNPSQYLQPEFRPEYEAKSAWRSVRNFTQEDREYFLIGMMKVNFLKRLESSIRSFQISMKRTIEKITDLEQRIRQFQAHQQRAAVDTDQMTIYDPDDEELQEAFQVGKKLTFDLRHLDVERWLQDLARDKQQLHILYASAREVTPERDAKLAELKRLIAGKAAHPTTNKQGTPNRKVLVFTAFADTANYLYDALHDWAVQELQVHIAVVTGGGNNRTTYGKTRFEEILTNFAPLAKKRSQIADMPQDAEIDLLIATDCISEGQNLQDCDYLVNYDIHWNPVRIIQRFGRIDRIGSLNPQIQLVNFWPTPDLNKYINLKNRVEARMALVDIAATSEENILNTEEIKELIKDELSYRDRQLLRLKDEILDFEDLDENVSLSEFTLDDFRIELLKYLDANRRKLEEAPFGLYAVVPEHAGHDIIRKGVIFCLAQRSRAAGSEQVNPLAPYFLVYVRNDGTVRFTFTHAKQILDIYRILCAERRAPYKELCQLFDQNTQQGEEMSFYNNLLDHAVHSIVAAFRKRAARSLAASRRAVLPAAQTQVNSHQDFDLVTWLVIV